MTTELADLITRRCPVAGADVGGETASNPMWMLVEGRNGLPSRSPQETAGGRDTREAMMTTKASRIRVLMLTGLIFVLYATEYHIKGDLSSFGWTVFVFSLIAFFLNLIAVLLSSGRSPALDDFTAAGPTVSSH